MDGADGISLKRSLHDWRDYWLAESRQMLAREAKVLCYDLAINDEHSTFSQRWWNHADLAKDRRSCFLAWWSATPMAFLDEAFSDLGRICERYKKSGIDTSEIARPKPDSTYFSYLTSESWSGLHDLDICVRQSIFGSEAGILGTSKNCLLSDFDASIRSGYKAAYDGFFGA
jgi:hypothetical protein